MARRRSIIAGLVVAAAAVPAGCGTATDTQTPRLTPASSGADVGLTVPAAPGAPAPRVKADRHVDAGARGRAHTVVARPTPETTSDDVQATGAKPFDPCTLVTASEAEAVIGRLAGEPTAAPLGPTCIYRMASSRREVTVSVQSVGIYQATHLMMHPHKLLIGGHAAFCGALGPPAIDVELPGERVLNVTASCGVGSRFAALALRRVQ